jgi:hypothetical protein
LENIDLELWLFQRCDILLHFAGLCKLAHPKFKPWQQQKIEKCRYTIFSQLQCLKKNGGVV